MPKYKNVLKLSKQALMRRYKTLPSTSNTVIVTSATGKKVEPMEERKEAEDPEPRIPILGDNEPNYQNIDVDEDSNIGPNTENETFSDFIIRWAVKFNIKNNALNELLSYLQKNGYSCIPKDSRTLLRTPKSRDVLNIPPGKYTHIGLKTNIEVILSNIEVVPDQIELIFNIDGVPITRSSKSSFWLILCKINNIPRSNVFVVGIYHGNSKPSNFNDFLRPLVEDIKSSRYIHNIPVIPISFICDAPAKSSVLGIKSHCGYFGCGKCSQEGDYINNRMTFPEHNALLRTNETFRNKHDEEHHITSSILEELDIDMVKQFPLDYLHVVCLGVMKKLLKMWVSGRPPNVLPNHDIKGISTKLLHIASFQPCEFQRKIRDLSELHFYKGTEFRTFLLYSGPFVLKNILSREKYTNFLLLHASILILCDKTFSKTKNEVARTMLKAFVDGFAELYGNEHVVYNVHSLIHLPDDVKIYGPLDNYSAFPFESYMSVVKRLLRKHNQPLSQLSNRISEINNLNCIQLKDVTVDFPILKKKKILGERDEQKSVYLTVITEKFKMNDSKKNKWLLTTNDNIIGFQYLEKIDNELYVYGSEAKGKKNFYDIPVASSHFKIFKTSMTENYPVYWKLSDIVQKLFCMECCEGNGYRVFFPLPHSKDV